LDAVLADELYISPEAERLELARQFNIEEHQKITMTHDGTLVEIKKLLNKQTQAENWCYKGFPAGL
jgi:hypothetical protein